jgi:hypothetical protein
MPWIILTIRKWNAVRNEKESRVGWLSHYFIYAITHPAFLQLSTQIRTNVSCADPIPVACIPRNVWGMSCSICSRSIGGKRQSNAWTECIGTAKDASHLLLEWFPVGASEPDFVNGCTGIWSVSRYRVSGSSPMPCIFRNVGVKEDDHGMIESVIELSNWDVPTPLGAPVCFQANTPTRCVQYVSQANTAGSPKVPPGRPRRHFLKTLENEKSFSGSAQTIGPGGPPGKKMKSFSENAKTENSDFL